MYDRIYLYCLEIVQEFFITYNKKREQTQRLDPRIQQIASHLQLHYNKPILYETLAARFGFSLRSLSRHWQKHFQTSPAKYVLNLNLDEAKRLLAETNASTEDISIQMNYNSNTYFCYMFRRMTGMTPLQYRRKYRYKR